MSLSVILPTVGRRTLEASLVSIAMQPLASGDEVLVIGGRAEAVEPFAAQGFRHLPCRPGKNWGCRERTLGFTEARGTHLAFLDDDDVWLPGARQALAAGIAETPDVPSLFQMQYRESGAVLWRDPVLRLGNVSTQMMLLPNDPTKLGRWTTRREGDYDFMASWGWPPEAIQWRPTIIAEIG